MESKNLHQKLLEIQRELKVEKGQWNDFSKFAYRSKEDILEAVKPLAHERGCVILCSDSVDFVSGDWVYIKSTATLCDTETGQSACAVGYAREPESKKGMDASQITGTAASYAGKRALGNLFAIDDTKDADAGPTGKQESFEGRCRECGAVAQFQSREQFEAYRRKIGCCANPDYEVC